MRIEEILQLVDSISRSNLAEFKYEEGGVKLSLKKAAAMTGTIQALGQDSSQASLQPIVQTIVPTSAVNAQAPVSDLASAAKNEEQGEAARGNIVKSPLVGTFYAAPSEDAEPYVQVGDTVKEGQVLAIVEAMKLMNDIESDFPGNITEILVQKGEAVEYGQPLFVIE